MKTRIITAALMVALAIVILIFSYIPVVMNGVVAILIAGGIFELFRASGFIKHKIVSALIIVFLTSLAFVKVPFYEYILLFFYVVSFFVFAYLMKNVKNLNKINNVIVIFISLSIGVMYKSISGVRERENGLLLLILAVLVGVLTDSGAYFTGRAIGKHKLAPILSPKKTKEGAVGGTLLGVFCAFATALILNGMGVVKVDVASMAIYSLIASIIGQFGDLAMSSIKRIVGIKDYGTLFPGHGGILDRFDSIMFVLPFTYLFTVFINSII
ncbi:MAG: phosphatidate cytidylyltransferase [Clostridia bacterium]|nr:phosphatidate cytidylyltransferase [Clostridia bacterium]